MVVLYGLYLYHYCLFLIKSSGLLKFEFVNLGNDFVAFLKRAKQLLIFFKNPIQLFSVCSIPD